MPIQKRSVFDLTHEVKLSTNMGRLVPIMCEEVLPSDSFKVRTDMLVRLAPMLAPVMHRITAYTHFFFVPSRLLMTNWEPFITGGPEGTDATVVPTIKAPAEGGFVKGSLADYFGLPVGVPSLEVLAFPFRAYNLIYNEWYRDQNLVDKVVNSLADGLDTTSNTSLLSRCWEKDYFTSALPWAQRGSPVTVNIGGNVPVVLENTTPSDSNQTLIRRNPAFGTTGEFLSLGMTTANGSTQSGLRDSSAGDSERLLVDPNGTMYADLSEAEQISINDLRASFQLQKWMERNARSGVRYVESILAHFGVRSSDARLQRPEFLGGGRSPIVVSEVLQTSSTDTTSPQGNMAGHGYSAQQSHEFTKSFEEHGYIIGILSIMPRTAYQQGVSRMWNRRSRLEWPWPEFAHLGEQAVLNKEIYASASEPEGVFGYAPRYEELRHRESRVCGDFRDSLDYWHMGRQFTAEPVLNESFVIANPTKRIFAVEDENVDSVWIQLLNSVQAIRPIPKKGVPGFIDH